MLLVGFTRIDKNIAVCPCLPENAKDLFNQLRMVGGQIPGFADIGIEIVELDWLVRMLPKRLLIIETRRLLMILFPIEVLVLDLRSAEKSGKK